jgi:large subunit ribosomal protein L3
MPKKYKPRAGSLQYYPHVRAKKLTPSFSSFPELNGIEASKPLNFLGYKAGMTHVLALNQQQKSGKFNQEVVVPATVIECPPLKVLGARAYIIEGNKKRVLGDVLSEKADKELLRKIKGFKKPKKSKEGKGGEKKERKKTPADSLTLNDLDKRNEEINDIRLLVYSQPKLTGIGKKKPDVLEIGLSGSVEQKLAYAKEKLGKELSVSEVFDSMQQVDVKSVTKGKGFQGVVKRAGVKVHRPKAKKHRIVGSISPWKPATVMWTVPRPGGMGYHNRTEFNKLILMISNEAKKINPKAGFKKYGLVKNDFVLITGSVPGPSKRPVNLRAAIRPDEKTKPKLSEITAFDSRAMEVFK